MYTYLYFDLKTNWETTVVFQFVFIYLFYLFTSPLLYFRVFYLPVSFLYCILCILLFPCFLFRFPTVRSRKNTRVEKYQRVLSLTPHLIGSWRSGLI